MGNTKSYDQVKSILGKLDRNIDAVRQRRLGPEPTPVPVQSGPAKVYGPDTTIGAARPIGQPTLASPVIGTTLPASNGTNPSSSKSAFGRAQPIRPEARSA